MEKLALESLEWNTFLLCLLRVATLQNFLEWEIAPAVLRWDIHRRTSHRCAVPHSELIFSLTPQWMYSCPVSLSVMASMLTCVSRLQTSVIVDSLSFKPSFIDSRDRGLEFLHYMPQVFLGFCQNNPTILGGTVLSNVIRLSLCKKQWRNP